MSAAAIGLFLGLLAIVLATAVVLAPRRERRIVALFVAAGVVAAFGKITLFQQSPQWHDTNPDSFTYDFSARAFALHWQGQDVSVREYNLRGLQARGREVWGAAEVVSYSAVFGSREWLYPAFVGVWYWLTGPDAKRAIDANAVVAGFFPAAAFGIALALGAPRRVAVAAGLLALVDPSAGVNASWLLKDSLAAFLAMAALWAAAAWMRERRWVLPVLLGIGLGFLGIVRFVAFAALLAVVIMVGLWRLRRREFASMIGLGLAVAMALVGFDLLYHVPQLAFLPLPNPVGAGVTTLKAEQGDIGADEAVLRWKAALRTNPGLAMVKSVAHTLFAPYPWVAIHPGLTWRSFSELYYPGVLLWILCLPGIVVAIVAFLRRPNEAAGIVIGFLGLLLGVYIVFLGEWSTRQRVFALPAFFALASVGWHHAFARWKAGSGR